MAVKQEIKYKVRKIDGTDGIEGTISLNSVGDGARYLVHRAFVAQSNKRRQGNGDSGCVVITGPSGRRSSLLTFSEACTAFISCRSLCVFDRLFKIPRVSL